jgi:hypothetical protein
MRNAKRHGLVAAKGGSWQARLLAFVALAAAFGGVYLTFRIHDGERAFAEGRQTLAEETPALADGIAEMEAGKQSLDEGRQAYTRARQRWHLKWMDRWFRGGRGFREAEERIAEGEQAIAAGEVKLGIGQDRLEAGHLKLQQGRERLTLARQARWACAGSALLLAAGSMAIQVRRRRRFPNRTVEYPRQSR